MRGDGFKDSRLFELLKQVHGEIRDNKELFLGIRDRYFNVYFEGASLGKFTSPDKVEVAREFLGASSGDEKSIPVGTWFAQRDRIKERAKHYPKKQEEKTQQQRLVLLTNESSENEYFAFDMEYNSKGNRLGRPDVMLISRRPQAELKGRHRLVMLELKCGTGAYKNPDEAKTEARTMVRMLNYANKNAYKPDDKNAPQMLNFGSGILGHCYNYFEFNSNKDRYTKKGKPVELLREDACKIMRIYNQLGLGSGVEALKADGISEDVAFVIYALGCEDREGDLMPRLLPMGDTLNVMQNTIRHQNERIYVYSTPSAEATAFKHDEVFTEKNEIHFPKNDSEQEVNKALGYDEKELNEDIKRMIEQQYLKYC